MPSQLDLDFARRLGDAARQRYPAERIEIRLFGSRARGDHHEHSDLDVLVLRDEALRWAHAFCAECLRTLSESFD